MTTAGCCTAALAFALGGLVPTPIGKGPRYQPPARTERFACRPASIHAGSRAHLELFANRRVVIVPTALGLAAPQLRYGRVVHAACRADAWTLDPTGVVRFLPGLTLARVFALWGQPLGPRRLASFRGRVSVYVDGRLRRGDPSALRLRDGAEIVLEVGGFVPPHRSYRFPP